MVNCRYTYIHPKRKWQINCSYKGSENHKKECIPSRCPHIIEKKNN